MPSCVFYQCSNHSRKNTKTQGGVTFHSLPKDELRKRKWLKIVRQERNEPDWTPTVHSRVCSEHFKPEDIYTTKKGMIRISPKAIPRIQGQDTVEIQRSSSRKNRHSAYKRIVLTRRGFTQAEDIVANVYNYLQKEFEELKSSIGDSCDLSPLANILKRTASATGVSEDAVSRILENKKRSADYERDAAVKRVKLTHDSEDGDDSSITDEESSCEEQEADQESTDDDNQKLIEFEVETLKVEIDEHEYKPLDPLQLQTNDKADLQRSSNVAVVPIVSNTTHTENTTQPAVVLYPQSSAGVLRVKPISSLTAIKTESDNEHTHSSVTCTSDVECDTTLCDVKCEPPDS